MNTQHTSWRRSAALVTLAAFLPFAAGCTEEDPGGRRPQGVEVTVTLTDSSGTEPFTATSDLDAETYPALSRIEGGAPADPQRVFAEETLYTLDTGDTIRFLPAPGGAITLHNGEPLGVTVAWSDEARTLRFTGADGSWVDAQLDLTGETARYYAGAVAVAGVIDAVIDVEVSNAVPAVVIVAGIGLAGYLACISAGCYWMCKNNCAPHGVKECGCGIKVWRETELGYWCKCKEPPAPAPAPAPTEDAVAN